MLSSTDGEPPAILIGAAAIAGFIYGKVEARRRIYYLVEKKGLPVFRLGEVICARTATLLDWIEQQERAQA